ncbi:MAG: ABC transporter ATP-binding protein [Candidatus Diapherotrites archaeon]|uniref:ABC transporter ATP-binding protein n=1 Tax=Candidatus Iainarchaeum sp. TaxID=3101447 RepID=A0A8T4L9Q6_9ARCH|nr:ABC transporter ATP-binding protein [Candidatus Diapherotrites archaeon]
MPNETIIEAKDVYKIFELGAEKVYALNGVNLEVRNGEFVSIMGPSGSGKTTFLDVLSCMERPTQGEVFIKGRKVSRMTDDELARVRGSTIGFVFQTFNLIPRFNAVENVMLPLWFKRVPVQERRKKAMEALKAVGLGDRLWHKPSQLSGGQRQRVAIARALAVEPEVIVADEPTGNLDSVSGTQILDLIADLHREQGKTILMVTHEKTVGARAEKIVRLMDGKIVGTENGSGGKK